MSNTLLLETPIEDQLIESLWSGFLPDCVRNCTIWFDFEKRELVKLDCEHEPDRCYPAPAGSWLIIPIPQPVNAGSRHYGAVFRDYQQRTILHERYEEMMHETDVSPEHYRRMREMVSMLAGMPRLISGVPASFKELQAFLESQKQWNQAALVWNLRLMNVINWRMLVDSKASVELLVAS